MTPGSANLLLTAAADASAYQISRSLRFRSSASAYLSRTPASAGNRQIYTYSVWIKRGILTAGSYYQLFGAGTGSGGNDGLFIDSGSGGLYFTQDAGTNNLITSAVYRDPSAWYHIVLAVDTTQSTASNRVKLYVNGVQVTSFSLAGYPTLNSSATYINTANQHRVGAHTNAGMYFDGYMTEVNFIDGQALAASSFGETDTTTGVWKPKRYTGTYGTNGFYLNFSDNSAATAAAIGKDSSGNGNNFTPNNISVTSGVTYDSMIDTPTPYDDGTAYGRGNYATLNPIDGYGTSSGSAVSQGNLCIVGSYLGMPTIQIPKSGKWYAETTIISASYGFGQSVGLCDPRYAGAAYATIRAAAVRVNTAGTGITNTYASYTNFAANDVLGLAYDVDSGTFNMYKNNVLAATWSGSGLTGNPYSMSFMSFGDSATDDMRWNFGQRPFAYTPPSGFKALNTQNLPTPTIAKGDAYFNVKTWSADVSNPTAGQKTIALGFQPDLVWSKNRDNVEGHYLIDSVRGDNAGNKWLRSESTAAEGAEKTGTTTAKYVFGSTGFDIIDTDTANGEVYYNGRAYVGWAWKKGATPGFDIVSYTGNGANRTIAHNLGVAPSFMIVKCRGGTSTYWIVWHRALAGTEYLGLNSTSDRTTNATIWNSTVPTSTVFSVGTYSDVNANGLNYIAYLFSEVAGFSKFGSYTGNGSTDGPFVYCGFRPRWLMIKGIAGLGSQTNGYWVIVDTVRATYNVIGNTLMANDSGSETTWTYSAVVDVLSNGFKPRMTGDICNNNGGSYIFAAFAENPFKYALAR